MVDDRKTPIFDFEKGEFKKGLSGAVKTATGDEAVKQIIKKAANTVRGKYLIYANYEDSSLHHKYGNDVPNVAKAPGLSEEVRVSEFKRAVKEALIYDPWITDVYNTQIEKLSLDEVKISCYVDTIYKDQVLIEEVVNNGG